jgi:hypothetical protein
MTQTTTPIHSRIFDSKDTSWSCVAIIHLRRRVGLVVQSCCILSSRSLGQMPLFEATIRNLEYYMIEAGRSGWDTFGAGLIFRAANVYY